jgi:hypothetical protein
MNRIPRGAIASRMARPRVHYEQYRSDRNELRLVTPVDPLTRLMMDADGVLETELDTLMRRLARILSTRPRPANSF